MKRTGLKPTLNIFICLLIILSANGGVVFAADTSPSDGGPAANLAWQKQVLTALADVAIKTLDAAETTVQANPVLSSSTKQAVLASLQGVEDQLISYKAQIVQAKTVAEVQTLNQQIGQYLKANKTVIIDSFKLAFTEIGNAAVAKAKQLEATLRTTLTLLKTLCPQQTATISTLETQLNTLNANLVALNAAIQARDVATILHKMNEISILIQSMNTNVKTIQTECQISPSGTTPTPVPSTKTGATPTSTLLPQNTGISKCPAGLKNSISTTTGCVQGTYDLTTGREMFLGIPYAEAPQRFSRSEPVMPWATPLKADKFGPVCAQYGPPGGNSPFGPSPEQKISDDCLTLNIWSPANAKNLPILFFIHGGGGVGGTGSATVYANNPDLAKNAIVVTINYRVGVTGILAHPELSKENSDGVSGNLDLRDIILALKWVKANAVNLGGDPQKITIFGQSSGALNVAYLLTSPATAGLFTGTIIQSAPFTAVSAQTIPLRGSVPLTGESFGVIFAQTIGCEPLPSTYRSIPECLRAKSVSDLNKTWTTLVKDGVYKGYSIMPVIDGIIVKDSFTDLLKAGQFTRVPVIMGVMSQESGPFGISTTIKSWPDLEAALKKDGPAKSIKNLNGLVALYNRPKEYESPAGAFDHYLYETQYLCSARAFLNVLGTQNVPARGYYNTRGASFYLVGLPIHGSDLFFIFGSATSKAKFSSAEQYFATTMQSIWTSVANNKPSVPNLGPWPLFGSGTWINLDFNPKIISDLRKEQCDFFDSQNIYFPSS